MTGLEVPAADLFASDPAMDRGDWLRWRQKGIGASDAAAICGLSRWASPYSVWLEKTGQIPVEAGAMTSSQRWGLLLEPAVRDAFAETTGNAVAAWQTWAVSKERPWMRATLDGLVQAPGGEILGVYEGKTSNGRDHQWDNGVPDYVLVQVMHQMAVTGLRTAFVPVLLGGSEFEVYEVAWDQSAVDFIIEAETDFWERNVLKRIAPPLDASPRTGEALRAAFADAREGKETDLPAEAERWLNQLRLSAAAAKDADGLKQEAHNALMAMLGDAEVGLLAGQPVVTWKASLTRRVDVKRLRAEYPEIAQTVTVESASRTLRIKTRRTEEDDDGY